MTQVVTRTGGIHGPEKLIAPDGWSFNKTDVEVWYWLLAFTRQKQFKRQRDKFMVEAKIEALANILANTLGMASTFWVLAAREIAK